MYKLQLNRERSDCPSKASLRTAVPIQANFLMQRGAGGLKPVPRLSWYLSAHPAVGGRHRGTAPAPARLPRDGPSAPRR